MAFSGALTLTDLNDFISPSQACIKPVEEVNKKPEESPGAKTEIVIDSSGSYYEVSDNAASTNGFTSTVKSSGQKLEQAQINLNDCLACSGCITSAESVLITLQSHVEVFNIAEANKSASPGTRKILVASVSPQSLASLAASLSLRSPTTPLQVLRRVRAFLKETLEFNEVFDTTFARDISLREHALEFEERKAKDQLGGEEAEGQLPMLASACPGWICYAEKAHPGMLPFISRTKSPQQVMGTLVKEWMGRMWGKTPDEIYHVSIMPCYDKKLEASRQDFYNDLYSTRDVDCVITTGELELMMKEKDWDLSMPVPHELNEPLYAPTTLDGVQLPELVQHPGSSSGSYLQTIIDYVIQTSPVPLTLRSKVMRNADYEEFTLADESSGKVIFKGAKCYGFRNLQNVVRKVGRDKGVRVGSGAAGKLAGRSTAGGIGRRIVRKGANAGAYDEGNRQYDYVEVMACPNGCVNGGGQLKPIASTSETSNSSPHRDGNADEEGYARNWEEGGVMQTNAKWGDKGWTRKVEEAYWLIPGSPSSGEWEQAGPQKEEAERAGEGERGRSGNRAANGTGTNHGQMDDGVACNERRLNGHRPHDPAGLSFSEEHLTFTSADGEGGGDSNVKTRNKMMVQGDGIDSLEPGVLPRNRQPPPLRRQFSLAKQLGDRILKEMCQSKEHYDGKDEETHRHQFFRTHYHAVESEVIGLAVKW